MTDRGRFSILRLLVCFIIAATIWNVGFMLWSSYDISVKLKEFKRTRCQQRAALLRWELRLAKEREESEGRTLYIPPTFKGDTCPE